MAAGGLRQPKWIVGDGWALTSTGVTSFTKFPAKSGKSWLILRALLEVTVDGGGGGSWTISLGNDGGAENLCAARTFSNAVGEFMAFQLGTSATERWPVLDIGSVGLKANVTGASGHSPPHTGKIWLEVVEY